MEVWIVGGINLGTTQIVIPVRTGLDIDLLTIDHGDRLSSWLIRSLFCRKQVLIIVRPRLVVIVHAGHVRIMENVGDDLFLAGRLDAERPVVVSFKATLVLFLIFPLRRKTGAGLRFDIVPPHVFCALAIVPDILAGHAAGMAPNALVQVKHHGDLRTDFHFDFRLLIFDC